MYYVTKTWGGCPSLELGNLASVMLLVFISYYLFYTAAVIEVMPLNYVEKLVKNKFVKPKGLLYCLA